jgi:two-component system, OmpR family, phosphate regulon sensor histidine kinase PhoR
MSLDRQAAPGEDQFPSREGRAPRSADGMKLASRFSLLFGLLALAAAAFLVFFWDALLDRASRERAVRRLQAEDAFVASLAAPLWGDPSALDRLVRASGARLGVRVTAIDGSGVVISDSGVVPSDVARMENHLHRPEVVEAGRTGTGTSRRFSATLDRDFVYLAERVEKGGRTAGFMRLAFPLDDLAAQESKTLWWGRGAIAASCLALFLVGHFASRRFAAPLRRVTEATLAVARGDLKRDPPDEDDPEAAALSDAVRRMKNSLLASLTAAESERRLTATVFDHLPSGLVVVDARGRILQANSAFGRMLATLDPADRPLVDVLREPEIVALFDGAIEGSGEYSTTWKRSGDATWEVTVLPLAQSARGKAIGIFRDVTPMARTEAMRRRFVADVSHELRTPVSSIAAAAETLLDASTDRQEAATLTALIARQANRMRDLIEDLTDLSRIESGAIDLVWEPLALLPVVRDVAADLAPRALARRVEIRIEGDETLAISGDRRRLVQIIHNLLDNAVKFSPEGEIVRARVAAESGRTMLTVEDRGPGIPESEREKIFQRFYQVDPSRSKAKPGTGLGLAIVKHLAALHHAPVTVGGEPGEGAIFRVSFPPPGAAAS